MLNKKPKILQMRPCNMPDPMWNKLDRHDEIISTLQQKQAATDARLKAMDERIDRNQHEIVRCIGRLEAKIDEQSKWMNKSKGGLRFGVWLAGVSLTLIGILATWVKFFKGG
jgi:hypothetical protein